MTNGADAEDLRDVPLIVGAGPAGLAAAATFVAAGIKPVVIDESARPGGQGTRRLSPMLSQGVGRLFGPSEARAINSREAAEDAILANCDYRPQTLAWGSFEDRLELAVEGAVYTVRRGPLLLATGAMDRILPVEGWTLPGVFTLGAAQIALKRDASLIGSRVVFAGSSPLLYLAALQYVRLGGTVAAVLDTTPWSRKAKAAPAMALMRFGTFRKGVAMMAALRSAGVAIRMGVSLRQLCGSGRVTGIRYRGRSGETVDLACDAVALGWGLRSEGQLAELAGAQFAYDDDFRQWFPKVDADGRASPALWIAGDGGRIAGADAAAVAGRLAALSVLRSMGRSVPDTVVVRLRSELSGWRRFQRAMTGAFAVPNRHVRDLADGTVLCRCERITIGAVRACLRVEGQVGELNRVKAITRCGMGRCQGRLCMSALAEIVADETGQDMKAVGRLRAQAPVRPLSMAAAGGAPS